MQGTVTLLEPLNTKNSSKKLAFFIKCASIYKETSIPVLTNVIIISLAFLCLPERHHVLMQRFSFVLNFRRGGQIANLG